MPTSNECRASTACHTIKAYALSDEDFEDDPASAVNNLLCDLMHLCKRDSLDFTDALANGFRHFQEEVDEEEGKGAYRHWALRVHGKKKAKS